MGGGGLAQNGCGNAVYDSVSPGGSRVLRALKVLRVLKIVRLLKLIKFFRQVENRWMANEAPVRVLE
jgi:hypothetical protein